jgi:uncharacterized protein (TIGR03032 family)
MSQSAPTPTSPEQPWLEVSTSRHFNDWLAQEHISIAITTYQAGKLILLGLNAEGRLAIFERTFNRAMGLWANDQTLWLGSLFQL